ncbi:MAG: zinc-dependent metalloproteinase lipoprotein [Odoribacter sp.]|nr:zinc-dependent metalloproteinase lipoprotein [Odoribacter sp.]
MKSYKFLRQLCGVLLTCSCLFVACSEEGDEPALRIPFRVSETLVETDAIGDTHKIFVEAEEEWRFEGMTAWCRVDKERGTGSDSVTVTVDELVFRDGRSCELTVLETGGESRKIVVKQNGALQDYVYRLPVVFHVLYQDADDINQNIHENFLKDILPYCSELFRQGHNGLDMGVEFYMATTGPDGKLLEEPGIDRMQWAKSGVSARDFIRSTAAEDLALLWNPNEYVNIVVFPFLENTGLSGISTMPYTVAENGLKGLVAGDMYFNRPPGKMCCVVLNTQYAIRPKAKQVVAHELGHFLGLFHVFSETNVLETDYCADTPNYNREAYMKESQAIIASEGLDSERLYERKGDGGVTFVARNVMDYDYTYHDEFTADQYQRIRHVLENSPLIPGIKKNR